MDSLTTLPAETPEASAPLELFEPTLEISWGFRIGLMVAAMLGWGLLAVAWTLTPDLRGFGSHEQLGLAPCFGPSRLGFRCPACGMTTSWNRLAHLDLAGAFATNAGGAMMGLGWFVAAPWMALAAWRGKWWGITLHENHVLVAAIMLLAVTLVDWVIRLTLP